MSILQVANVQFETTGANRIEYTGNNVVRVRANGGFQLPFGTTAQRAPGENGLMRYNTDTGLVESYGSGAWSVMPDGVTFNAAYTTANAGYSLSNTVYAAVNSAFAVINAAYTAQNTDYTSSNAAFTVANAAFNAANNVNLSAPYNVANAAFAKANTALQNTAATVFAGSANGLVTINNTNMWSVSDKFWGISGNSTVSTSWGGLTLYGSFASGKKGSFYWESGSGFGLLNNTDSWSVKCNDGGSVGGELRGSWTSTVDHRAPIFYDSANTAYYVDPASVGTSAILAGNVGIGAASAGFKLDVYGTVRLGYNGVQGNPSSTDITSNAHTLLSGTGGNYLAIGQYGSGSTFAQWIQSTYTNPTTAVYNLVLNPLGGNVGIGSTAPLQKLEVVGVINSTDSSGGNRSYIGWKSGSSYGSGLHFINVDNSSILFGTTNIVRASIDYNGQFAMNSGFGSVSNVYGTRAWASFAGSTGTISHSGGVSSITRSGTGQYTVNFSTSMPDADHAIAGSCRAGDSLGNAPVSVVEQNPSTGFGTGTATIWTASVNNGGARVIFDPGVVTVISVR